MKKSMFLSFGLVFALAALGTACSEPANNAMNHNAMNHNSMDHNSMPMNSMPVNSSMPPANSGAMNEMRSDADAASAPFDLQFIDTMTQHHEEAIRMAETALKNSQNEDLKKFAQQIIDAQTAEVQQMSDWREKWYTGKATAKNMNMPGMKESMSAMATDANKFSVTSGKEFDLMFINAMIPHHEGAVKMAKDAQTKAEHAEIKTLAAQIIKAQQAEIKMMNDWKARWAK
jgi:uncharacterized protein (DUF305 family)